MSPNLPIKLKKNPALRPGETDSQRGLIALPDCDCSRLRADQLGRPERSSR